MVPQLDPTVFHRDLDSTSARNSSFSGPNFLVRIRVITCSSSSSGISSYINTYTNALGVGAIIAIVVGILIALGVCIAIIVVLCILAKRKKRAQVWAVQAQQQTMNQPSIISATQQQQPWPPATYQNQYPSAVPMNYGNPQYAPTYS
ncbi:unnamed protein product [Adineta steineri]|uniref:Uncharacterized protein n=1 Tax=Adineta steineri TaxID=433720 RepID=A0A814LDX8_9BILA|nr:unnamed protein product [Adineta steineri]